MIAESKIRCYILYNRQLCKGFKNDFEIGVTTYYKQKGTEQLIYEIQSDTALKAFRYIFFYFQTRRYISVICL